MTLAEDAAALADHAARGEDRLAALPAPPARDAAQRDEAAAAHDASRRTRRRFLARHADAVYDLLTDDRTRRARLPDLVFAAADRFPGLVPTRRQMDAERAHVQADKEGREIDQGIFCAAVLRSRRAGTHLIETMLTPTARATELLDEFRRTGRTELGSVLIERDGPAAHVEFRNGDRLNSEDNRLIADLETAVDLALLDDQVRVGVLRGGRVAHRKYAGRRVFSAGVNLADLCDGAISFVEFMLGRELGYVHKLLRGVLVDDANGGAWADRSVQKPWVGAVDAFAIGGGMQLLLVLDRVIAESGAYFSLPAAHEGIVPGLGNLRLGRWSGARTARRVILGGHRVDATDPEATLLCDEVVAPDDMDAAIGRAVHDLAAPAVSANRRMLTLAEEPIDLYREYLAEFAAVQASRVYAPDVLAKVEHRRRDRAAR
ncbi:hypothetical protein GCM10022254_62530 [Actinomadura meridiana]|uniref:3,5-dihydroxyphenylacetyl-CoA monooxygenase n=1 Tax=Actinomadura meridiana TaxID=559626 RepID=A0ABP8CJU2_9ACTN